MVSSWRVWLYVPIVTAGCIQNDYDIRLRPAGDALERTLIFRRNPSESADRSAEPGEEANRIAREYHSEPQKAGQNQSYHGRFAGPMPNDVGGYGRFTRWETSLGAAHVYIERFRGRDDAFTEVQDRRKAVDRLIELLVEWLDGEFRDDPAWLPLRQFLDEEFRHDLHNLSLYAWTSGLSERSEREADPVARVVLYFLERKYFSLEDVPQIRRALEDSERGDAERLMALSTRLLLARVAGKPPRIPENLSSVVRLKSSLSTFLERSAEYAELRNRWEEQVKTDRNAKKPDATEVLGPFFVRIVLGDFQLGGDRVSVSLKADKPPLLSNGRWSKESAAIDWPAAVLSEQGVPRLVYAIWDEPNSAEQTRHFGHAVLEGDDLLNYCTWHHGLRAEERTEWDAFVDRLKPGPDLARQLTDFRFAHEPATLDPGRRVAVPAINAIANRLPH